MSFVYLSNGTKQEVKSRQGSGDWARMGTMFRWLLKINFGENPDDVQCESIGKYLAIMSPLGTIFVHEGVERCVSWLQAVRAEVIAASIDIQIQRYPMFTRFVAIVGVSHEGDR